MEHDECLQRMIEINQVENNITLLYSDLPSHQLRDDCLGLAISKLKERNQSAKNMQNYQQKGDGNHCNSFPKEGP